MKMKRSAKNSNEERSTERGGGNRKKKENKKEKKQKPRGTAQHHASPEEVQRKKLARILHSNGPEAAWQWAESHGAVAILDKLARGEGGSGGPSKVAELANASKAYGK